MSSLRRRFDSEALRSARSIAGWPVMWERTGEVILCDTSFSICGWSYLTAFASVRSTETTIIAAVGFGRRPALAVPASHADSTRVCARLASAATSGGP